MARFILKYPTRSRPQLAMRRIQQFTEMASGEHDLRWLVSCDADDATMNNIAMREWFASCEIDVRYGNSKTKIEAANADMQHAAEWDVLLLVSDDFSVNERGWDDLVWREMATHFPDLNGALWYPDGNQLRLCTLSIMGRPVYDDLGCIYHHGFKSVFCDDYFQNQMIRSNRLRFVDRDVFRHEHRRENNDWLMRRNASQVFHQHDQRVYRELTTGKKT